MNYLVGVVLAVVICGGALLVHLGRDRTLYAVMVAVVASYYVLFAVIGGDPGVLIAELAIFVLFLVFAVAGFRFNLWFIVGALFAHGVFDIFHHRVIDNSGLPHWWPGFCLSYDLVAAVVLGALLWSGGSESRRNAQVMS